jgi:hypothetical protein
MAALVVQGRAAGAEIHLRIETDMNMNRENELWPMAFFVFAMLVSLLVIAVA